MRPPTNRPRTGAARGADDLQHRLDRLDGIALRMDKAFRIPFTPVRFGWDSVLGLVPGIGDTLALAPAAYILHQAHGLGASRPLLARMAANTAVDWMVGLVPIVGDLFDVRVKSNTRNMALLRKALQG